MLAMDPRSTLARTATTTLSSIHQGIQRSNFPLPSGATKVAPQTSGPVTINIPHPEQNIVNVVANQSQSLYHVCLDLEQRLLEVPGLAEDLKEKLDKDDEEGEHDADPVSRVWKYLRQGYPLIMLYNALKPVNPIKDADSSKLTESKLAKARTFKFLQACMGDLGFQPADCFLITDLYEENTTGFVKVTKVVNRVLDKLSEEGKLTEPLESSAVSPSGQVKASTKEEIKVPGYGRIREMLDTERSYILHLENLQSYKKELEECGLISGDVIHGIFLNLNPLLDFAQRFLIQMELHYELPYEQQNWGKLFVSYSDSFRIYEPFIGNERLRQMSLNNNWDKIQTVSQRLEIGHQMTTVQSTLQGFLLKPFQRLSKYPLLLKEYERELSKSGVGSQQIIKDLQAGQDAMAAVLSRANEVLEKQELQMSLGDLETRVDDWKGHRMEHFGDLLICGPFTVVKSDTGAGKDVEREYQLYLFERILLCCKDMSQSKQKSKLMGKEKYPTAKNGKPKLQLKGRIFIQNITDVVTIKKSGDYTMRIYWKGDPGVENFVVRFQNEEQLAKWEKVLNEQRDKGQSGSKSQKSSGTSATEFTYMKAQTANLPNPYLESVEDEDEDDDELPIQSQVQPPTQTQIQPQSQVSSSFPNGVDPNNLRSRSATGGSSSSSISTRQMPPPPMRYHDSPYQPPVLHTNVYLAAGSPSERSGDSYFSPTIDSPTSTRSSSQSGMFPFPRQPPPPSNLWSSEDGNRHTAPAMSRNASKEGPPNSNGYPMNGRSTVQRPSLPAMASQTSQQMMMMQQRMRSASTPDIHNPNVGGRRYPNGQPYVENVPVPPIPQHMRVQPVNRSQNNSPNNIGHVMPGRAMAQAPPMHNHRMPRSQSPHPYPVMHHPRGPPMHNAYDDHHGGPPHWNPPHNTHVEGVSNSNLSRPMEYDRRPSAATIAGIQRVTTPTPQIVTQTQLSPHDMPSQLKARIKCMDRYVTLIIPINITYQTLVDRIDAKLSRTASRTVAGTLRIKYRDIDDDLVTIDNDEAVQDAIIDWREQNKDSLNGDMRVIGEIDLFCTIVESQA